jgi:hypothetical protein
VAALHLEARVEWVAPVAHEALPGLLAGTDVCVAPLEDVERNRAQGAPVAKLGDYLAAGKPVVAADLPLTRAQLPAAAALFHPPGDAHALAAQLVTLARAPSLRRRLGEAGRAYAERTLDAATVGAQLLALYRELLGAQRAVPVAPAPTATLRPPTRRLPAIGGGAAGREPDTEPGTPASGAELPTDPSHRAPPPLPRASPPPLPPRSVSRVGIPALPTPAPARPPPPAPPQHAGPELLAADEAEEVLEVDESALVLEPAASGLSPWLAQLAHGYCPPEGTRFSRHTPPTNFPGREDETDPARAAPTPAPLRPR